MESANVGHEEAIPENTHKRGSTRGAKWKKVRDQKKEPVVVEIPECFRRAVGDNAQQFITETSYLVKQHLPLNFKNWAAIDMDLKVKLMNKVKELYVLPDGAHVDEAIQLMVMNRYRNRRYRLRKHYLKFNTDKERLANCPKTINPDEWKWLVERHWSTKRFRRISEANKQNQKKQKMSARCGTISFVRTLTNLRNDKNEEDDRPEYIKLFLKERKKKNGEWSDNEAEAAFNKLQELHKAQVEEHGTDNLTIVEAYTRIFGHKSGYVRGLGEGPRPLKRANHSGLNTLENYVSEADLKVRIQTEVELQVAEISKKKEEEMSKRFAELAEERDSEIRKLRADMLLLLNEKKTSLQEPQNISTVQTSNPPKASKCASSAKDQVEYYCLCGSDFTDTESYMVHLRSSDHIKNMSKLKNKVGASSVANNNAAIRRMKQEKK